jgi:hypothetical protein
MSALPKPGDTVRWNTSQGETEGVVRKIVKKATTVKGYTAKASPEHPEVVVESAKSGKPAVHKPESLTRV